MIRRHVAIESRAIVLDVGCGDTFVVEQLAERHPDALIYAVDTAFTEALIDHFSAQLKTPNVVLLPSLDRIPPSDGRCASLVLLMDVVEHVEDPKAFLDSLCAHPLIGPSTIFIITVPSYQGLYSAHDMLLRHYRRYSNKSLQVELEAAGLEVKEIGYFFSLPLVIRVAQVLTRLLKGGKPDEMSSALAGWRGTVLMAAFARRVLGIDAAASMLLRRAGIRLPGLSNYAIARKRS